ncbi:MAG: L-glutamate gamma-semialdehyde dehydrogenase, partial [Burkholderiales bacterium]
IAAALAAGNVVLAKPAEQTPLVAAEAVRLLWSAGVPRAALQLLPGPGEIVGAALAADARVQGVLFTGSTDVARILQRTLAGRFGPNGQPVPLVAETGGQNAMIVDSSALVEQAVGDALASAFDSAGQRCSALRVLCLQRDMADRGIEMLLGAMRELQLGDPRRLACDVGPVIDAEALSNIEQHIEAMRARGRRVTQISGVPAELGARGTFACPTVIEIESLAELEREVFGPVLHVLRYDRAALPDLLEQINATGYGLTLGVHTRIDETVAQVVQAAHSGNLYVNRNVVGAVVGVQPFGGEGLSGTGPKAGGPLYLLRLLAAQPADAARRAVEHSGSAAPLPMAGLQHSGSGAQPAVEALAVWASQNQSHDLADICKKLADGSPMAPWRTLAGPTGEANLYAVCGRDSVLCLAETDEQHLAQLAAVLAVGASAIWPASALSLWQRLPHQVGQQIALAQDVTASGVHFDAVLHAGSAESATRLAARLAERPGPIALMSRWPHQEAGAPLARLTVERSLSINTAAAGGNASLMTIG